MNNITREIPFILNGKKGFVEVCYDINKSASKSGFDLFKGLGFPAEKCIGYPTMFAHIKNYEGTGYSTGCAWIQIITDRFFSSLTDHLPTEVESEVDANHNLRKLGVPFFSFGFPAAIYDAPCNNLGKYARLEWIADTFLVTMPSRINDDTISYLLGFRWGYEESRDKGNHQVKVLPLEVTNHMMWTKHLPLLRGEFPNWRFI